MTTGRAGNARPGKRAAPAAVGPPPSAEEGDAIARPGGAKAASGSGSAGPATSAHSMAEGSGLRGVRVVQRGAGPKAKDGCPITHEDPQVFERLLAPLTVDAFLKDHYVPKQPVVVRGHDLEALIAEGMEGCDAKALLAATPSERISVWTVGRDGKISTARVEDAASATALWRAGHSCYCRAPEELEQALVASTVRALGLGFRAAEEGVAGGVEGEVELFLSRRGHATPFHFDFQENWTLQLRGRKRWRLLPGVDNPVRGCTPHYAQAEGVLDPAAEEQLKIHRLRDPRFHYGPRRAGEAAAPAVEVVLEEGDLFYHPAGMWHAVDCVEDSVSINVSLDGTTYADHIAGALRQALLADGRFTAMVQTRDVEAGQRRMAELLRQAAARMMQLADQPSALLPPCVLWGQPLPPLDPAAAPGDEDGLSEQNGDEEGEEEEQQQQQQQQEEESSGGSSEAEEEEDDEEEDLGKCFPVPLDRGTALSRNPLTAFFALDDVDPPDGSCCAAETGKPAPEAFMVHFGFGHREDLASVVRKKVVVDRRVGRFVGSQAYDARFTAAQVPGGGTPGGLRTLGALVHLGVLLVVDERGATIDDDDDHHDDVAGLSRASKKKRT